LGIAKLNLNATSWRPTMATWLGWFQLRAADGATRQMADVWFQPTAVPLRRQSDIQGERPYSGDCGVQRQSRCKCGGHIPKLGGLR
jgi:hypothetical protein